MIVYSRAHYFKIAIVCQDFKRELPAFGEICFKVFGLGGGGKIFSKTNTSF